ncbi:methionine gamma-lyase [Alkalicella caledoniensis]|uniref:L-methionine gamma-lyase n=1 Tax=Alkalicella caledoniensis TaxID=2731377 RepID=A0A7G9WA14_ALKCA|nr:methionine gamma-lyase [Alkalicella caledoniensis]QNO15526.1 methionine gamma-lyase [Alkalicella caledoniensis]
MKKEQLSNKGFSTQTIHGGHVKDEMYGSLAAPIYATSTYIFDSAEQGGRRFALEEGGYIYSRLGNPTVTPVEEKLALLEEGEAALATASGIGAISSALWTILKAGDHIVADETLYGCTYAYMHHGLTRFGVEVTFVDASKPENVKNAMKENTKVVYIESPVNPHLKIIDIAAIAEIAHAQEDVKLIVDNTFATPYLQKPLTLGADVVVHSATKYLNGHGDVIAGFVVGSLDFVTQVRLVGVKDMTGASLSPFDAFLVGRGMKTLDLRMERHCANGMAVAEFLEQHPMVERVYYPGLKNDPYHEAAKKQMKMFGGIVAFEVKGGFEAGKKVINSVQMCKLAVSLGDAETLVQHPASMTHSTYTPEELAAVGISTGLVRVSAGLENAEDIIADLAQALEQIK